MNAAIYVRKSTDQNGVSDEQKSVARQIEHGRAYAQRKGWTVSDDHVYVDDGISGAEFAARPGFCRLMNAVKPRAPFQFLIMSEESRLGREAIETAYALKQLVRAGVRVFFYLEDRERTLDSPTDKIMMSLTAFADELERERARVRTYDALTRKARAGHVTGGLLFGYNNIEVTTSDGRRSHVTREIDPAQAEVVRRIFRLCAEGYGVKAIAKLLNSDGAPSPRAQLGRVSAWAPSTVREVLARSVYRGEIVWNQSRKRDRWGQHHQVARPETEWIHVPAPHLRILSDEEWQGAQARLNAARAIYLRGTNGERHGRPALGSPSKYLLTNFATCGKCGGSLRVRTRGAIEGVRPRFYGCANYHERGLAVCGNRADIPMETADMVVLEALLDDVLTPDMLTEAVDEALRRLRGDDGEDRRLEQLDRELAKVDAERRRLAGAIASGGNLDALLQALREREASVTSLTAQRQALASERRLSATDLMGVHAELLRLAEEWRQVLAGAPTHARSIVRALLVGRVTFTPLEAHRWRMQGAGTLAGLFTRDVPVGVASPAGFDGEGTAFEVSRLGVAA